MNSNSIHLNIGGKYFETTQDTLSFSPYFKGIINMNGSLNSTRNDPYFIDRDPKIFRHILNLLRNPDYNYPAKYLDELEFYGFNIDELKPTSHNSIMPIYYPPKDKITNIYPPIEPLEPLYIKAGAKITFFKHVYQKHTDFEQLHIKTWTYDTLIWTHHITGDYALIDIYILIPQYYYEKLEYFTITIGIGSDSFNFNLAAVKYLQNIDFFDGLCCIDLMKIFTRNQPLYIYKTHDYTKTISVGLKCTLNDEIKTTLKIRSVSLLAVEYEKFNTHIHQYLLSKLESYEIAGDRFILPVGEIAFIIFNTTYDSVAIEYFDDNGEIIQEKSYIVSKFDARFLNKYNITKNYVNLQTFNNDENSYSCVCGKSKRINEILPNDYGLISFGLYDSFQMQPSGSLTSTGRQSIRFITNKENNQQTGTIWVYKYCVVTVTNDKGYFIQHK